MVVCLSVGSVLASRLPLAASDDVHHDDHEEHHHEDHDDRARTVTVGVEDYENLTPIIVDQPPQGVDFSSCAPDESNQYCCVDFVSWTCEMHHHDCFIELCISEGWRAEVWGGQPCAGVRHEGGDSVSYKLCYSVQSNQGE